MINVAVANGADPQVLATAFTGALDSYIRSSEFPSDLARSGESSLFNGTTIGIIVAPNTTVSAPSGVRPKHHRRARTIVSCLRLCFRLLGGACRTTRAPTPVGPCALAAATRGGGCAAIG